MKTDIEQIEYIVFNQKLAGYLMLHSCKLIKLKPDKHNPSKWVYLFPYNDFILDHVEKYKELRKTGQL